MMQTARAAAPASGAEPAGKRKEIRQNPPAYMLYYTLFRISL